MTSLQDHISYDLVDRRDEDDSLLGDWLGLAGYLAEAVAGSEITADIARSELAAEATGEAEHRALGRAAALAETWFGSDAPVTALLQWALTHSALAAPT